MKDSQSALLRAMFQAAVDAALPERVLAAHLPPPPSGRTLVVGAGKASAAMAAALEAAWEGPLSGLVVTRYGHAVACREIEIVEAAHPVPDAAGEAAARRMLDLAATLEDGDLMIALISGGGSSLLSLPAPGLTLADKQAVNRGLLACGASIGEMNCLRKHLSAIKGGRLAAAAYPARTLSLIISDVPGDDPAVIASGPTVGDGTSLADARAILKRYDLDVPPAVAAALEDPRNESPDPAAEGLSRSDWRMIAAPQASLEAAAKVAAEAGIAPMILGDAIEGEAREVGKVMAGIARQVRRQGQPLAPPCVLISGGETTVTLRGGEGSGGRNVEFLLGLTEALAASPGIHAIACDTDGVDGAAEVAGALVSPDSLARARQVGRSVTEALDRNDGHGFFAALGDQVITGPTLTNVNDFRAILVTGET
ncbi:MAG: glycerate kinase [Rhodospirillales bacterium]